MASPSGAIKASGFVGMIRISEGVGLNGALCGAVGRQYSRLVLDAQSWALDFRGFVRGLGLKFDARYAEWLLAIFEPEISERTLEVVGAVDIVRAAGS